MRNVKILPYKIGSESAKAIAEQLDIGRIKLGQNTRPIHQNLVVNWGCSAIGRHIDRILNKPSAVALASNKLKTFKALSGAGIPVPEYTETRDVASGWLDSGFRVLCRHKLSGHNGDGIEVIEPESNRLPRSLLYVKYIKKVNEYRVHVFQGKVIDITEKRRRNGEREAEGTERYIRNLANGWVFCRDNIRASDNVRTQATKAVKTLGLDFGAVDVVVDKRGSVYILEVNTAPGLVGTTLDKYVDAIQNYVEGRPEPTWGRRQHGWMD